MHSSRSATNSSIQILAFLAGLFSSMPLFEIFGIGVYAWLVILFSLVVLLAGQFRVSSQLPFVLYLTFALVSCVISMLSSLPGTYLKDNVNAFINLVLIFILAGSALERSEAVSDRVVSGIKLAARIQAIWIIIQFISYKCFTIDINHVIFNALLGISEQTSQYKATGYIPTGLCWNAGGIAAALIIGFCMESRLVWRFVIFLSGILTQSRTILIGFCFLMLIEFLVFSKKNKLIDKVKNAIDRHRTGIIAFIVVVAGTILLTDFGGLMSSLAHDIIDKILFSLSLNGGYGHASTAAHAGYYLNLPALISSMGIQNILFGYGLNCSGFPYTNLTGQYAQVSSWCVESDPVNTLLSSGIMGLATFYAWMGHLIYRCWKRDRNKETALIIITLTFMGIFYNVQSVLYSWLILAEIALAYQTADGSYNTWEIFESTCMHLRIKFSKNRDIH